MSSTKLSSWLTGLVLAVSVTAVSPPAAAVNAGCSAVFGPIVQWAPITTVSAVGTLAITGIGGGVMTTILANSSGGSSEEAALRYLRRRRLALQRDIRIGGGQTVEELARSFRIDPEERDAFADMLRRRRKILVALTRVENLNQRRARQFFREIARGIRESERLEAKPAVPPVVSSK